MATYLETHPGPIAQWRTVRRNGAVPTGTTVIHTYECPYTWSLEQGARGIAQRSDRPASYHCLAGDGSGTDVLQMAPWSAETWHETSTNNWAVGISMLTYAGAWTTIPRASADNLVRSAAYAAYLYATWLKATRGITIPARRITRTQALARQPGFIGHGEIDVGRRTDPGASFDWALFLTEYARFTTQEDDMLNDADRLILRKDMLEQAEKAVANRVADIVARTTAALLAADVGAGTLSQAVRDARVIARRTEVAVLALPAAIIAALPPAAAGASITPAQVEAAVKSALSTLQLKSV